MMRTLLLAILSALPVLSVPAQDSKPSVLATLVVLNKSEASASLIDPATGEVRGTVAVGDGPHEVAVSPDGRMAVVCNYGRRTPGHTLSVIDVPGARAVATIELHAPAAGEQEQPRLFHRPHGIAYLRDGKHVLVTAEAERRLLLVDVPGGKVAAAIPTDQEVSHMVVVGPRGRHAFVANIGSGSVSVIDLEARKLLEVIPTGKGAEGIAVHPGRNEVWVTNRAADTVSIIDAGTLEVVAEIESKTFPIRVAFTPDGAHALVSNARAGTVAIIDTASRKIVRRIRMDEQPVAEASGRVFAGAFGRSPVPVGVLVQPDGRRAYVASTQADVVTILDLSTWTIAGRLRAGKEPDGLAFSVVRVRKL